MGEQSRRSSANHGTQELKTEQRKKPANPNFRLKLKTHFEVMEEEEEIRRTRRGEGEGREGRGARRCAQGAEQHALQPHSTGLELQS